MRSLQELLGEAASSSGHRCSGQVLGVRMAMLGCRSVGVEDPTQSKNLIVYVEIDRCATDAIQAVTGCRLGRRTMKFVDYGKVAATFLNTDTGEAVRVVARDDSRDAARDYSPPGLDRKSAQRHAYRVMPDRELFCTEPVRVDVPAIDLPGRPIRHVSCDACGERVNDGREVLQADLTLCRACAEEPYYRPVEPVIEQT